MSLAASCACVGALIVGAAACAESLGDDLELTETQESIVLENSRVALTLSKTDGGIDGFRDKADGLDLLGNGRRMAPCDVYVGQQWLCGDTREVLAEGVEPAPGGAEPTEAGGWRSPLTYVSLDVRRDGRRADLLVWGQVGDWRLGCRYLLAPGDTAVKRRLVVEYEGDKPVKLQRLRLQAAGARVGEAPECVLTLASRPPVHRPYAEWVPGRNSYSHSSQHGAWCALLNPAQKANLLAGSFCATEYVGVIAKEQPDTIQIRHELYVQDELKPGAQFEVGSQFLEAVPGGLHDVLRANRRIFERVGFAPPRDRPSWAERAALYSVPPGGSMASGNRDIGGFENLEKMLPWLKGLGLDAIWLLPINPGGYAPAEHFDIAPNLGTHDDCRRFVQAAHDQGFHVLFDLIPHGPRDTDEDVAAHPEWVSRDQDGEPIYEWGCLNCDYAHPEWQEYQTRVARWFMEQFGNDGYRVDVAAGGTANWARDRKCRPSQNRPWAGNQMLNAVRQGIRERSPDAILFAEAFGANMFAASDWIYDYPLYWLFLDYPKMDPAEWVADLARYLEYQKYSFPDEIGLVRFTENHDTVHGARRWGHGVRDALMGICCLARGTPMVFCFQDEGGAPHLRRLLRIRRENEEFLRGEALYMAVTSSAPGVLSFARVLPGEKASLVLINFTPDDVAADVRLRPEELGLNPKTSYVLAELPDNMVPRISGDYRRRGAELDRITVKLRPYEVQAIAVREAAASGQLKRPPLTIGRGRRGTLAVTERANVLEASTLHYRVVIDKQRGGMIRELSTAKADALLGPVDVREGNQRVLGSGPPLALSDCSVTEVKRTDEPGAERVLLAGLIRRGQQPDVGRFEWEYVLHDGAQIDVALRLELHRPVPGMNGDLAIELPAPGATHWVVNSAEGLIFDDAVQRRPKPGDYGPGRYWHRSGQRLWEASCWPLDERAGVLGVYDQRADESVLVDHIESAPAPLQNVFVTMAGTPDASPGRSAPVLHLAFADSKGPVEWGDARILQLRFRLRMLRSPREAIRGTRRESGYPRGPTLRVVGSNYVVENEHYRAVIGRSAGGHIRRLEDKRRQATVLSDARTYSDRGIFPDERYTSGWAGMGSSHEDVEPDVQIRREGEALRMRSRSFLRRADGGYSNVGTPRVQYQVEYTFDTSPTFTTRCGPRVMLPEIADEAFLAKQFTLPDVTHWFANTADGLTPRRLEGPNERFWQSRETGWAEGRRLFGVQNADAGWRVELELTDEPQPALENVFLHRSGESVAAFIAWRDFQKTPLKPRWEWLEYRTTLGEAQPEE